MSQEFLDRLDELRGDVKRSTWVKEWLWGRADGSEDSWWLGAGACSPEVLAATGGCFAGPAAASASRLLWVEGFAAGCWLAGVAACAGTLQAALTRERIQRLVAVAAKKNHGIRRVPRLHMVHMKPLAALIRRRPPTTLTDRSTLLDRLATQS